MSQKEATKPGRAFTSSVCLEIVIPFPASALLETVLGSEGSAGVLLGKANKDGLSNGTSHRAVLTSNSVTLQLCIKHNYHLTHSRVPHFAVWNTRLHLHIQMKH